MSCHQRSRSQYVDFSVAASAPHPWTRRYVSSPPPSFPPFSLALSLYPYRPPHPDRCHGGCRRGLPHFPGRLHRSSQILVGFHHLVQRLLLRVRASRERSHILARGVQRVAGSNAPPLTVFPPRFETGDGGPVVSDCATFAEKYSGELILRNDAFSCMLGRRGL